MTVRNPVPTQICLNVFGYLEDGVWYAHALEMDIVGTGATFEEAFADLDGLVRAQIGFAVFQRDPNLLWHPAPREIVEKFYDLFIRCEGGVPPTEGQVATAMGIPPQELLRAGETYCSADA